MKIFIAFALFNLTLAMPNSPNTPKITVQQDRSMSAIPIIDIVFPDGHEDKMALKRHFVLDEDKQNGNLRCNFLGRLEKDREACLAVTGCPGQEMKFTIHSRHNVDTNKYVLHPSGAVESIPYSGDKAVEHKDEKESENIGEINRGASGGCTMANTTIGKPLPPTNEIKLKVSVYVC